MKKSTALILFLFVFTNSISQNSFVQIEANKVLCMFSFLETASGQRGASTSYQEHILQNTLGDGDFAKIINEYGQLNLEYGAPRQEFPDKRYSDLNSKDLIWVAASNAKDISDFSERIIGYLPHQTHVALIKAMESIEPYFDKLIWDKEQLNIERIIDQMSNYKSQIADAYLSISNFYNTSWDQSIPFKISLYPIPLEQGNTTAIPKGNILICGFLAHLQDDYKGILGVSIHEMCHILFGEQSSDFQHQIDQWFKASKSPYANLAYSYLDEGLATALGNGWAYEQINGELDQGQWYFDEYIDGFAHAIFPLVKEYLAQEKSIDQEFVNQAIDLFGETFPKAIYETKILMNEILLFANPEEEEEANKISDAFRKNFRIRSMWFSTPINDERSFQNFKKVHSTKIFVVDSDNENTIALLNQKFSSVDIKTPVNSMDILEDPETKSCMILINIDRVDKLSGAVEKLANMEFLEFGKNYRL